MNPYTEEKVDQIKNQQNIERSYLLQSLIERTG